MDRLLVFAFARDISPIRRELESRISPDTEIVVVVPSFDHDLPASVCLNTRKRPWLRRLFGKAMPPEIEVPIRSVMDYVGPDHSDRAYDLAVNELRRISEFVVPSYSESDTPFWKTAQVEGIAYWWLIEVSFFNPIWLTIRYLTAMRRVLQIEEPDSVLILGNHERLAWKAPLLRRLVESLGIPEVPPHLSPEATQLQAGQDDTDEQLRSHFPDWFLASVRAQQGTPGYAHRIATPKSATSPIVSCVSLGQPLVYRASIDSGEDVFRVAVAHRSQGTPGIRFGLCNGHIKADVEVLAGAVRIVQGDRRLALSTTGFHGYELVLYERSAGLLVDGVPLLRTDSPDTCTDPGLSIGHINAAGDQESAWLHLSTHRRAEIPALAELPESDFGVAAPTPPPRRLGTTNFNAHVLDAIERTTPVDGRIRATLPDSASTGSEVFKLVSLGVRQVYETQLEEQDTQGLHVAVRVLSGQYGDVGFGISDGRIGEEVLLSTQGIHLASNNAFFATDTRTNMRLTLKLDDAGSVLLKDGEIILSSSVPIARNQRTLWFGHLNLTGADTESIWRSVREVRVASDNGDSLSELLGRPARKIAVILDMGSLRHRYSYRTQTVQEYDYATESFIDDLFERCQDEGVEAVKFCYGARQELIDATSLFRGNDGFLRDARGVHFAPEVREVPFSQFIDEPHFAKVRRKLKENARRLVSDPRFTSQFSFMGIPYWDNIADNFEQFYENVVYSKYLYSHAFERMLATEAPDVVISSSFEGHWRVLTPVARRHGVRTVGIVLGFYRNIHLLQHAMANSLWRPGKDNGFAAPDRLVVWGNAQRREIVSRNPTLKDTVLALGRCRSDTFAHETRAVDVIRTLRRLDIPEPFNRCILFIDTIYSTNGTNISSPGLFRRIIRALVRAAETRPGTAVVLRPWSGDNVVYLRHLLDQEANPALFMVEPLAPVHNVELLAAADVVVGTPTSFFSEALIAGCSLLMLDSPDSLYYYGEKTHDLLRPMCRQAIDESEAGRAASELLSLGTNRRQILDDWLNYHGEVFGPHDGANGSRITDLVFTLLGDRVGVR